ncbi:Transcription factor, Myb superfamily [Handroanthus impetiginosus]|uniref:Transcription factor, Myb superfamily n=1 Tax=Handroanthus impetiginosus TaxID=429701 RepID=A0A2G9GD37_9LAMI|nr:Transcription factor, Myb superfamily [Handroanthus impetiginosus]
MVHFDEMGEIKKGPWKAEEDKVLINHVKKYGPRNWSSIRSKGLLQRTGKSCRLRWVNKLRPDLKSGVKFSAEEERTVIDLQAKFGNKWARIATYLSGRTDNDVKNFWSSRQKRLARMLHNSAPSSSSKSQKSTKDVNVPSFRDVPSLPAPNFSSSTEEEFLAKSQSCSLSHIGDFETINMASFPVLEYPDVVGYEHSPFQIEYTPPEKKPFIDQQSYPPFPSMSQLQPDFPLPLESQDYVTRLGDPYFLDVFGQASGSALGSAQIPIIPSFLSSESGANGENQDAVTPDSCVFDDFPPIDMFDHIEPLPSPSDWP